MPVTQNFNLVGNSSLLIPSDMYSMTIRLWGGGGGGEHISNNGTNKAGQHGGNTTLLGFIAGGGLGGGRNANNSTTENLAGRGGIAEDGDNWEFYGASVSLINGADGQSPDGNSVTTTTATVFERTTINRYLNTNPSSAYFGDRFTGTASPNTDWAFERTLGAVFDNQPTDTDSVVDDNDNDLSNTDRPFSNIMGFAYTDESQIPNQLSTTTLYLFERTHGSPAITDRSYGTTSTELTNFTGQTATVNDIETSVTYTGLSNFSINITKYTSPEVSGTEGNPVGSLKYIVDIVGLINPTMSVNVLDVTTRAGGTTDPNNSIEVAPEPLGIVQITENQYEIAFQMISSQDPSEKQATFVKSFSLTMAEGDYTLVDPNPVYYIPDEDLTVITETVTETGFVTDPVGGIGGTLGGRDSKDGGNGSNDQVVFYSSMQHIFNNTTDQNIVTNSSPDVYVVTENQTAADGLPCATSSSYKRYGIYFFYPYDNSNYTFTMLSFCQQAAGGSTNGPFTFAGTSDKTANSIKAYFCRQSKNGYIRCFTFQTSGKKSSHRGSGGGGSAHVRAFIDRETFENHPNYSLGQTYNVVVGAEGQRGTDNVNPQGQSTTYSRAQNGERGFAEVEFIIQASALLKDYTNNVTGTTQLLAGQALELEWTTGGDNEDGTFLLQDGVTIQEVLNNSRLTVSPNVTTTYSIVTSGLGGTAISDLLVEVYQLPELQVSIPSNVDYGINFDLNVETNYANNSVSALYVARYFDGTSQTVVVNGAPNNSASLQEDFVQDLGPEIDWTPLGPETIDVTISISGTGGFASESATITVNIDRLPDSVNIPDSRDKIPLDQVVSPDEETVLSDPIVVTGIDIPVEIKSNYPIEVRFNDDDPNIESNWKDVRQII
jgi:hypothetical protein